MSTKTRLGKFHLLEIAERLFTEYGYQAVSIRDIAQEAGVTNAALYYHFPNKAALFEEVIEHHAAKMGEKMLAAGASVSATRPKIASMLQEYTALVYNRRSPLFLLRRKLPPAHLTEKDARSQHAKVLHTMLRPLHDVLQNAIENGELKSLPDNHSAASLLLGLLHGMMQHRKSFTDSQVSSDDIDLLIDIFWSGLENKGENNG